MENIYKIVTTGGPSGGKTTLQRAISEEISDSYCVPEVATILLSGGFPAPTDQHPWDYNWQRNFQVAVASGQIALENVTLRRAKNEAKQIIIFDRGIIDGASYLQGGISELEVITSQSEQTMLSRYDLLLHLTTSALHNAYDKKSNPHRFEDAEAAIELDKKIMDSWKNHPNRIILDESDKSLRVARGLNIVRGLISD